MNLIEKILFEQDIDIGVGREYCEPDLKSKRNIENTIFSELFEENEDQKV